MTDDEFIADLIRKREARYAVHHNTAPVIASIILAIALVALVFFMLGSGSTYVEF